MTEGLSDKQLLEEQADVERIVGFVNKHPVLDKMLIPVAAAIVGVYSRFSKSTVRYLEDAIYQDAVSSGAHLSYVRFVKRWMRPADAQRLDEAISRGHGDFIYRRWPILGINSRENTKGDK